MSIIGSNILAGASGQGVGGYTIETSLRLRSSASAYLSRTPATASNRKTWTWSAWVKRGTLGAGLQSLFVAIDGSATNYVQISISSDKLYFYANPLVSGGVVLTTTQVMRDPSAWMHIIAVLDTTNATPADRAKLYINGVRVTSFTTNNAASITLNADAYLNAAVQHNIGNRQPFGNALFDGYLTEVNFIDGQALDPSSFGEYNADTAVWQPVKYAGTYGTNGFYLPFSDATTTTTLGADSSGNGNDWTTHNISLTAGVTYDSMTDTPTPYAGGGNYAVLNPLSSNVGSTSNANLQANCVVANWQSKGSSIAVSTGKWYWENTVVSLVSYQQFGISPSTAFFGSTVAPSTFSTGYAYQSNATKQTNDANAGAYGATFTTGDVIGVALDLDTGDIEFFKNGVSQGIAFTGLSGEFVAAVGCYGNGSQATVNFGQRPFAYTPPTGFKALHTGNLPDSSIVDGSQYFNAVLYTGNTSGASVTGVGFQPDFVWTKGRSAVSNHELIDVVRGGSSALFSHLTNAETTDQRISSFDSDGWTYTTNSNSANTGQSFVGWNWKANGTGVSNTDGSITSTVSANPTAGFSIVSYTGTGANATVGHGLGTAPSMIILKPRNSADNWPVWHKSFAVNEYVYLNLTNAKASLSTFMNSTLPSSTVISLGTWANTNTNTQTMLAYCFAEVESYSKFGSYVGNGSSDGPFVYLGFRPAFVMVKRSNAIGNWQILDTARSVNNVSNANLYANLSNAEVNGGNEDMDILSNGWKPRNASASFNISGSTYIYMAFAENPFKNSLAR